VRSRATARRTTPVALACAAALAWCVALAPIAHAQSAENPATPPPAASGSPAAGSNDAAATTPATTPATTAPAPATPVSAATAPAVTPAPSATAATAAHHEPPVAHAAPAAAAAHVDVTPPTSLTDLAAWTDYKTRAHVMALPEEARLFYRRGLMAHQSGSREEGIRLVRGASDLDPGFVAPRLTLASWFLLQEPSQALLQYAAVLDLARQNFVLQLALVANASYLGLQALFLGLLAAAVLLIVARNRELRHGWQERLGRLLTPGTARWWSWALLLLPFCAGFGLALPTVALLGWLWPTLRARERTVFILLVGLIGGAPWIVQGLDRLAMPLREDRAPLYGVALLEGRAYDATLAGRLGHLAEEHPDNPYVQFGLAWISRRGGNAALAERAYRKALEAWPNNDRVMNDLATTLAMQGHPAEALELFRRATAANPNNAAAWFNASQIYTQQFDYRAASDAVSRASALNFDLVKTYEAQSGKDGSLPLVDQWLSPRTFWRAIPSVPAAAVPSLPPAWRVRRECSGLPYSACTVALALLSVVFGILQHRAVPLRTCSNCDQVVCRRCAERRREQALCPACAAIEARAESPDFARVLLQQHRRKVVGAQHILRTAMATLVPGYGLLSYRRLIGPVFLLALSAGLAAHWLGLNAPFSFEPRLAIAENGLPLPVMLGLWLFVYACSLLGYFGCVARERAQAESIAAPTRSRSTQATRHSSLAA
jgi:tetratricopeptide (TPR) repeat protein